MQSAHVNCGSTRETNRTPAERPAAAAPAGEVFIYRYRQAGQQFDASQFRESGGKSSEHADYPAR